MSILSRKQPVPSLHKKLTWKEQAQEFWLTNQGLIGLLIVIIFISIILIMVGYAAGSGHIHFFSTEANTYEHLDQIVAGGR